MLYYTFYQRTYTSPGNIQSEHLQTIGQGTDHSLLRRPNRPPIALGEPIIQSSEDPTGRPLLPGNRSCKAPGNRPVAHCSIVTDHSMLPETDHYPKSRNALRSLWPAWHLPVSKQYQHSFVYLMQGSPGPFTMIISNFGLAPCLRTAKMENLFATVHDCCVNSIVKTEVKPTSVQYHI